MVAVKCEDPYVQNGQAFPCGRCLPCLFNRRRIWTHRILLEMHQWTDNTFVTLTYSDANLRFTSTGLATLAPWDTQSWLKRLRTALEAQRKELGVTTPHRIRFYLAGEYGDETWRPHYHAALFNFPTCVRGRTLRRPGSGRPIWEDCCANCHLVGTTWGHGDVDLGILETSSAQYVAGYVTKKLTRSDDPLLKGRHPEFSRMSNRPGIGGDAMHDIADQWMRFNLDKTQVDVPSTLRHGSRELPLGRYLRRRLRKLSGLDEKTPQAILDQLKAELQPVRQAAFDASISFKSKIQETSKQKIANFHARQRIFKGRKSL